MKDSAKPIGVFDSGLGGLSVVKALRAALPNESLIYFGDLARLPYGTKSKAQIITYSIQNATFLLRRQVKLIVIACNSSSSAAHWHLKRTLPVPVIDVIDPAAGEAVRVSRTGRIGVIATQATVEAGTYEKMIRLYSPKAEVMSLACPLFVPLVEEGWISGKITDEIIHHYLSAFKKSSIDTLMLGCTHYPLLRSGIQKYLTSKIKLVDSGRATAQRVQTTLKALGLLSAGDKKGSLDVFVSDQPRNFVRVGEKFLGEKLRKVKVVPNA